jgi:hypothetical protein
MLSSFILPSSSTCISLPVIVVETGFCPIALSAAPGAATTIPAADLVVAAGTTFCVVAVGFYSLLFVFFKYLLRLTSLEPTRFLKSVASA